MLRATFAETPGGPVQRVAERGAAAFEVVDATGWSDAEVHARLHAEAFRPFDLAAGPLLRAVLLRRGDEAFLALAVHHIAADFWSMAVLARELGALAMRGRPCSLRRPCTPTSPAGRSGLLEGPAGERLWEHWRERLAGTPRLDLPTDRLRRPVRALRGGVADASPLGGAGGGDPPARRRPWLHALRRAARRLAGRALPLERPGGIPDRRPHGRPLLPARWADVVGYFVNLVPLRADLSGDPAVGELMARTRGTVLDALAHQDLPFALLTERLQPERDPGRPPLVAAMLTSRRPRRRSWPRSPPSPWVCRASGSISGGWSWSRSLWSRPPPSSTSP